MVWFQSLAQELLHTVGMAKRKKKKKKKHIKKMKYYAITWINFENPMLNKRSQTWNVVYCMIPFTWNIQNRQIQRDRKQTDGFQDLEEEKLERDC